MATVLVVDDDAGMRDITSLILKLAGDDVCTASDGVEAIDLLATRSVDPDDPRPGDAADGRQDDLPRSQTRRLPRAGLDLVILRGNEGGS